MLSISIACKARWPSQGELSRKIVHIGTGPVIPLAWWLNIQGNIAIPIAIFITLGLFINHHWRFIPSIEDVKRQSYGTITYGFSLTVMLIIFWPANAACVCAGILVMAFGDGLAGLIGQNIKSPSWKIFNQRKSFAGTVTIGIVSIIILLALSIVTKIPIQPIKLLVIAGLAVGLEQISKWGLDNLTVPIGVAYAWSVLTTL